MKKLLLSLVLLVGVASLAHAARGEIGAGWNSTTIDITSQTIFTGRGQFKMLVLSSGADATAGQDWCMAIDTQVIGGSAFASFISTDIIVPQMVFLTTGTFGASNGAVAGNTLTNSWGMGDGDYIDVKNGLFILKNAANSGLARRCTPVWRKD